MRGPQAHRGAGGGKEGSRPTVPGAVGGPFHYRAISKLQVLVLLDVGSTPEDPEPSSTSLQWWTRSQWIRTAGQLPFQVAIFEQSPQPAYQRIAKEARRLRALGLSAAVIGTHLGVTDKTVSKALAWIERTIES